MSVPIYRSNLPLVEKLDVSGGIEIDVRPQATTEPLLFLAGLRAPPVCSWWGTSNYVISSMK
jgi:hypothetical protein